MSTINHYFETHRKLIALQEMKADLERKLAELQNPLAQAECADNKAREELLQAAQAGRLNQD
jgi:hypothetical protein